MTCSYSRLKTNTIIRITTDCGNRQNVLRMRLSTLKKSYLIPFFSLFIIACGNSSKIKEVLPYEDYRFTTESAAKGIEIAKMLGAGKRVSDQDWENLFNSKGYKSYFIYSNSQAQKALIKNALETVFMPNKQDELDNLFRMPVVMNENFLN